MSGRLFDTYVAALQHDLADVPADATRVGVVRRPTPWFWGQVDENVSALAPPADLLDDVKARQEELVGTGLDEAAAHNRAMAETNYDERYREHLDRSADARDAVESLRRRLGSGEDLALVCYENTDEKRCHRTLLRQRLEG